MRKKLIDFKLYLITNRKLITHHSSLIRAVRNALKGGVKAIQLREKDMDTRGLLKLAYRMRDLTKQYNAKLFVNDRFDIALAAGADGVHLTQNSIPTDAVKKAVRNKLLIGLSTHSLKEARKAEKGGADFITLGPVYVTPSKLKYGAPLGIDALKRVSSNMKIPVFAIGGIKSHRMDEVKKAGAYGVAMISEIFKSDDIQGKAKELIQKLENDV
jgi:thiamine-phosphate pyrophosphorylase